MVWEERKGFKQLLGTSDAGQQLYLEARFDETISISLRGQYFPNFHFYQGICIHCLSGWCHQQSPRCKSQESACEVRVLTFIEMPHKLYHLVCPVSSPLPPYHQHPGSDLIPSSVSLPPNMSHQTGSCSIHLKPTCLQSYGQKPVCPGIDSPKDQFTSN